MENTKNGIYYHIITPYAKSLGIHPMIIVEEIYNTWQKKKNGK
jgi:hypothetical protein